MNKNQNSSWKGVIEMCRELSETMPVLIGNAEENVVVFGAGAQGRAAVSHLRSQGVHVRCYADNAPGIQGSKVNGLPVVSPEELVGKSNVVALIANRKHAAAIRKQLTAIGVRNHFFDAYCLARNLGEIKRVRNEFLVDEKSQLCYDGILKSILSGDTSHCAAVMEGNQYFPFAEFVRIGPDHFVDAGAYVGDTVERFIWSCNGVFEQIHAFEPGKPQFQAMKKRVGRLSTEWAIPKKKISCIQAGLCDKNKKANMAVADILANSSINSKGSAKGANAKLTQCLSLDSYLNGRPATFIKADIEGMEVNMLQGARQTIEKYKPKMAISIYHTVEQLYEIAAYVKSIEPGYQMAVRHHSPIFLESILYCWME